MTQKSGSVVCILIQGPSLTNCFELLTMIQQDFGVLEFVLLKLFYLYKFKYSKVRLCNLIVFELLKILLYKAGL